MPDVGFPYIATPDAKILILGSMPGRKSLAEQQYYAHAQNSFWPIMSELLGFPADLEYSLRLQALGEHRVALWDVAYQCVRAGSLDQAIKMDTVVANDFATFFCHHRDVKSIFFNGRKAEQLFRRLVLSSERDSWRHLKMHLLPSTSPAHATISRHEKCRAWKIVKEALESG